MYQANTFAFTPEVIYERGEGVTALVQGDRRESFELPFVAERRARRLYGLAEPSLPRLRICVRRFDSSPEAPPGTMAHSSPAPA